MKANKLIPLLRRGDGSTLSLDFTAMSSLDSRFTFTRASTGTYINSAGLVTTMAAASTNDPTKARFDYDPTTLAPRGLLIEGSATNELLWSNAFNTYPWNLTNFNTPSIASPAVTDPAGGTNTWYGVPSGTGYHGFRYTFVFTAAAYTFSIWAKAAQHDKFIISELTNGTGACRFDLTAKTATVIAGAVTPTNPQIVQYPNGWFRCSFTMQMSAVTVGMSWSSYPTGATTTNYGANFTATGTDGMYFYGAQMELGSGASSYIPTGSSTVQRAADDCRIDNVATSFGFNSSEGTILIQYGGRINTGSNRSYTFLPASGSNDQIFEGSGIAFNVFTSGSFVAQIGATSTTAAKVAAAYKANDFATSVNGGAVATDTAGAVPTTITRVSIGGSAVNAAAYNNGPIIAFKYWPTRLPNATLQSLTQ